MSHSDDEDDGLGFSLGLGLGGVLQDAGVDVAAFSSFFGSSEAGPSGTSGKNADGAARLAEIEGEDDDGKYMDDDDDLGASGLALAGGEDAEAEREARARAQAKEKAEQEEWMRRGLEMQREAEQKAAAKRRKLNAQQRDGEGKKEETPLEVVRRMWPGWQPGNRLRMSQVFYQTPLMEEREWREGVKRKRRHFGIGMGTPEEQAKEEPIPEPKKFFLTIEQPNIPSPETIFDIPHLPTLDFRDPSLPLYNSSLRRLFDPDWIRAAKAVKRAEMLQRPYDLPLREARHRDADPISMPADGVERYWLDGVALDRGEGEESEWTEEGKRPLDLVNWEKEIVWDSTEKRAGSTAGISQDGRRNTGVAIKIRRPENGLSLSIKRPTSPKPPPILPRNDILATDCWADEIIWDATKVSADLFSDADDQSEDGDAAAREAAARLAAVAVKVKGKQLDPYNLSNDHLYEHTREARNKIRQTFGAIEVFHAGPAKALQMPFYKTSLSKQEARAWKRPPIHFPVGVPITFSKLRSNPSAAGSSRKKLISDPSERFKTTKDLTLAEKGPYILLEFSEEYPPIMSGYGMGTTLVNYYRKKDDKDDHVPKLDFGQPSILNVGDAEPFLLGYVDKGKVTQVIHNNLLRAPIYKHQAETSDFLVIRHTVSGHSTYHIRPITNLYTVGQTVPNESEVPGPHARKNTTYAKVRLQIVAWILIKKEHDERIRIGKLLKYFPDQSELQMRQRLKIKGQEFLIYNRAQGPNQGFWILNKDYPNPWPDEREDVLRQATPEQASLYEAMQVGARHLYDAGYTKTAEGKDEEDPNDENSLDIEQRLAVWSTTLNYKKAEQAKAWLVVHGEGDPTGRGEGWSFLRGNMKGYFLKEGETEQGRREFKANGSIVKISNSEQNKIYDEEKRRIWDRQLKALSDPVPPTYEEPEADEMPPPTPAALGPGNRFARADSRRAFSRGPSMAHTPYAESPRAGSPALSMDGSTMAPRGANQVLRIVRTVRGVKTVEVVKDPAVMESYWRRYQEREVMNMHGKLDELKPTGDTAKDALQKQALVEALENLKKNQARRAARKKYALQTERGLDPADEEEIGKRKCGACGRVGHTKANRHCPLFKYNQFTGRQVSPGATATPGPTPGGFGGIDYFAGGQGQNGAAGAGAGQGQGGTPGGTPKDVETPGLTKMKIKLGGFK